MSKSGAEKIQFILNNHEQAYRRLKPVYTFRTGILDFGCSADYIPIRQESRAYSSFSLLCMDSILGSFPFTLFPKSFLYSRSSESAQPHGGHQRLTRCKAGAA